MHGGDQREDGHRGVERGHRLLAGDDREPDVRYSRADHEDHGEMENRDLMLDLGDARERFSRP